MKHLSVYFIICIIFTIGCKTEPEKSSSNIGRDNLILYNSEEVNFRNHDGSSYTYAFYPLYDTLITTKSDMGLEEKFKWLTKLVSTRYFDSLEIHLLKLEELEDGVVAHVELMENPDFIDPLTSSGKMSSWYQYFQGSTGGSWTTGQLRNNLLQKHYTGEWIEGIIFYYNSEPMGEWDHVYLEGRIWRYDKSDWN